MSSITEKQRRWTAVVLITASAFVILLGLRHLLAVTREPFEGSGLDIGSDNLSDQERQERDLKAKDTDNDGLNDFEELTIYNTSPYLADSDSDGDDDKTEIMAGKDPNCPGAKDCYGAIIEPTTETGGNEFLETLPASPKPGEIRQMLIQGGASSVQVNALSDEEVLAIYQQTYNELSEQ